MVALVLLYVTSLSVAHLALQKLWQNPCPLSDVKNWGFVVAHTVVWALTPFLFEAKPKETNTLYNLWSKTYYRSEQT